MKSKKIIVGIIFLIVAVATNVLVAFYDEDVSQEGISLHIVGETNNDTNIQVYYIQKEYEDEAFSTKHMSNLAVKSEDGKKDYEIGIPANTVAIRVNPENINADEIKYDDVYIAYKDSHIKHFSLDNNNYDNQLKYYYWDAIDCKESFEVIKEARVIRNMIIKILICVIFDILLLVIWIKLEKLIIIPKEVFYSRRLIGNLAKNDFKQKFAGSYLGTVWAFVQPIITVLVYWFVFEKALNVGTQSTKAGIDIPFVLWLIAGLVPWFYFSEVLSCGTNSLIEYNYLVKKVVFKISTLPVVKAISSLFVHAFFIVFTIILYSCYSYFPTLYTLQLIYYSLCMFVLSVGLIYAFSAIMVFFRDLSQIINVLLQVGMWMTPIMWNMDAMASRIPGWAITILKLNPMYYIVNGYRDALYNHVWFWERPGQSVYFWLLTLVVLIGGTAVFRKLQQHFADVL